MTKDETIQVLKFIKTQYQHFDLNSNVANEWYKICQNYDLEDVQNKLVDHCEDEKDWKDLPNVYRITKYLPTIEEKRKYQHLDQIYRVECNLCGRWMNLTQHENHYSKCSSISYLLNLFQKEDYEGEKYSRKQLEYMSEKDFNNFYEPLKPDIKEIIKKMKF